MWARGRGAVLAAQVVCCLLLLGVRSAAAETVFSSYGSGGSVCTTCLVWDTGAYPPAQPYSIGMPFTVPAEYSYQLDTISLTVFNQIQWAPLPTLIVYLNADAGGLPGAALEKFTFAGVGGSYYSPVLVTGRSTLHPLLRAGVRYWLTTAVSSPNTMNVGWMTNSLGLGGTVARRAGSAPWYPFSAHFPLAAFRVTGTPTATPPLEQIGSRIQQAIALDRAASLSLVPYPLSGTATPSGYRIEAIGGSATLTKTIAARSDGTATTTFSGLTNGTPYSIRAFALNAAQVAGPASPSVSVTPQAPSPPVTSPGETFPYPVLLLHGYNSSGETWETVVKHLTDLKFKNVVAPSFTGVNQNACEQAVELKQFIADARARSGAAKVVLVGHSQGGLVGRAYMQAGQSPAEFSAQLSVGTALALQEYACYLALADQSSFFDPRRSDVAGLITYGTPHNGADEVPTDAGHAHALLKPGSRFLSALNDFRTFPLPTSFPIVNLVGRTSSTSDEDCIVSTSSQSMRTVGYTATDLDVRTKSWRRHSSSLPCRLFVGRTPEAEDASAIAEALGVDVLRVRLGSPADIEVVDPAGNVVNKTTRGVWGATYEEAEDEDGHKSDVIQIPAPLPGRYAIKVIPDSNASSADTFSLYVEQKRVEQAVVTNMAIGAIGASPFVATVNHPPVASAGTNRIVRLGSEVQLNGQSSFDPDNQPRALEFSWSQVSGQAVTLIGATTSRATFTPLQTGQYVFRLVVFDGSDYSRPAQVVVTVPMLGDIDGDGDVDSIDQQLAISALNSPADGPNDLRDLNGDGRITGLDVSALVQRCTRRACATQ